MVNKESIKEAGKHLLLWRKIYNLLCRRCKRKLFLNMGDIKKQGTESTINNIKEVVDHDFCLVCKKNINVILKNYDKNDK